MHFVNVRASLCFCSGVLHVAVLLQVCSNPAVLLVGPLSAVLPHPYARSVAVWSSVLLRLGVFPVTVRRSVHLESPEEEFFLFLHGAQFPFLQMFGLSICRVGFSFDDVGPLVCSVRSSCNI